MSTTATQIVLRWSRRTRPTDAVSGSDAVAGTVCSSVITAHPLGPSPRHVPREVQPRSARRTRTTKPAHPRTTPRATPTRTPTGEESNALSTRSPMTMPPTTPPTRSPPRPMRSRPRRPLSVGSSAIQSGPFVQWAYGRPVASPRRGRRAGPRGRQRATTLGRYHSVSAGSQGASGAASAPQLHACGRLGSVRSSWRPSRVVNGGRAVLVKSSTNAPGGEIAPSPDAAQASAAVRGGDRGGVRASLEPRQGEREHEGEDGPEQDDHHAQ